MDLLPGVFPNPLASGSGSWGTGLMSFMMGGIICLSCDEIINYSVIIHESVPHVSMPANDATIDYSGQRRPMAYTFPQTSNQLLKHKHSSTSIVSTSSCPLLPGNDVVIMSREKESSEKADTLPTEDDRLVPSLNCLVQFHLRHLDKERF